MMMMTEMVMTIVVMMMHLDEVRRMALIIPMMMTDELTPMKKSELWR
jgi:hypothetical protein